MSHQTVDQHLCFAIYSAWSVINRTYKPILAKLDLTYTQYLVLALLWEKDNRNVKNIGEALYLGSNTLTPLLKRLEAKGFIQRVRDSSDDRLVNIILTKKGKQAADSASEVPGCIQGATGVSAEELGALRDQVQKLRDQMEASEAFKSKG